MPCYAITTITKTKATNQANVFLLSFGLLIIVVTRGSVVLESLVITSTVS